MPRVDTVVECPIVDSFRVQQVAGMFHVPLAKQSTERFTADVPSPDDDWQIGLIVGPSASGKSTLARQAYAPHLHRDGDWPRDRAVIDCFGDLSIRTITGLLTAVGFSSPPAWLRPFRVLSGGEQFRCQLARALATSIAQSKGTAAPLVVFDEFTSVVDRTVAKVCSAALAKGIRQRKIPCRFVAVTCHYDVAEWLGADWVLDMASRRLDWRRLRRPPIELQIHRCRLEAWELFKRHHYLTGSLAPSARAFLTTWNDQPVAFCATLPVITRKNHRRFTRIVTLPDYQGVGIGMHSVAAVARLHRQEGHRINVTSSHPALIRHCLRSPLWKTISVKKSGSSRCRHGDLTPYRSSLGRPVVSFEFVEPHTLSSRGLPTAAQERTHHEALIRRAKEKSI